jgi:hypothetical protein
MTTMQYSLRTQRSANAMLTTLVVVGVVVSTMLVSVVLIRSSIRRQGDDAALQTARLAADQVVAELRARHLAFQAQGDTYFQDVNFEQGPLYLGEYGSNIRDTTRLDTGVVVQPVTRVRTGADCGLWLEGQDSSDCGIAVTARLERFQHFPREEGQSQNASVFTATNTNPTLLRIRTTNAFELTSSTGALSVEICPNHYFDGSCTLTTAGVVVVPATARAIRLQPVVGEEFFVTTLNNTFVLMEDTTATIYVTAAVGLVEQTREVEIAL